MSSVNRGARAERKRLGGLGAAGLVFTLLGKIIELTARKVVSLSWTSWGKGLGSSKEANPCSMDSVQSLRVRQWSTCDRLPLVIVSLHLRVSTHLCETTTAPFRHQTISLSFSLKCKHDSVMKLSITSRVQTFP